MKKVLLVIAMLAAPGLSAIAQGTWSQKANFPGAGKVFPTGFSIGAKGYLGTGKDTSCFSNDFWEFDPSTNIWTQKASVPGPKRMLACGFSIGDKGYIGLGVDSTYTCLKDFWEYDPNTNVWTQKADFAGGIRSSVASFCINNKGYISTGFAIFNGNVFANDLWEFDPSTDIWVRKADFPAAGRSESICFSIGNKGYVGTGFNDGFLDDFWEWDQTTNLWTQKTNFGGGPICDAAGFSICSKGFVCTGENPGEMFSNALWEYFPDTNIWVQQLNFGGIARDESLGITINNKGYVGFGGEMMPLNDLWEYTPEIPCSESLAEIYFESDFQIYPNPATNTLTIETPSPSTIEISTIQGQPIKTFASSSAKTNVDVSALPCGIYIVEVKTEKGVGVKKFIKE